MLFEFQNIKLVIFTIAALLLSSSLAVAVTKLL